MDNNAIKQYIREHYPVPAAIDGSRPQNIPWLMGATLLLIGLIIGMTGTTTADDKYLRQDFIRSHQQTIEAMLLMPRKAVDFTHVTPDFNGWTIATELDAPPPPHW